MSDALLDQEIADRDRRVNEIRRLLDRVQADKKIYGRTIRRLKDIIDKRGGIFSTTEQINAAVAIARRFSDTNNVVWNALKECGIVRCERCRDDRIANYCPDCNGHGWVVKDE